MSLIHFNILVLIWIGLGLIMFPIILKIPAPYGRHSRSSWGPMISNKLGWFVMEAPALFVFAYFIATGKNLKQAAIMIFAFLWLIHYFNRVIIFPLRIRTGGKKMPVVIMIFAFFFNSVNGFINGYWFGKLTPLYPENWLTDPRFICGGLIFITGFVINQHHDRVLIHLRKSGEKGYEIPHGGLFRFISCPNFFGEIVEWAGFALMTWCLPGLSFIIWTAVNLIPRALDHHRWYHKTFEDYPKERKAIIPFVI